MTAPALQKGIARSILVQFEDTVKVAGPVEMAVTAFQQRRLRRVQARRKQHRVPAAIFVECEDRAGAIAATAQGRAVEPSITAFDDARFGLASIMDAAAEAVQDRVATSILVQSEDGALVVGAPRRGRSVKYPVAPLKQDR